VDDKQTNSMHDSFPYSIATRTTKQSSAGKISQLQENAKNTILITLGRRIQNCQENTQQRKNQEPNKDITNKKKRRKQ
jgi:hypothetical protein